MSVVQSVLEKSPGTIIPARYYPIIEIAETEDSQRSFNAVCELVHLFANGTNGVKKNYPLAVYYSDMLLDWALNNQPDPFDPYVVVENMKNRAVIEGDHENWEEAREKLLEAYRYQVANMEPEEWDGEILDYLYATIQEMNPELFE
ncbi:hypothetical protein AB832_07125 [Flavobacteriaceae bacterium (ex Bugula neritina AB1)]|nr:hypothetical protein AB832_07125 [Flavobacteriaceae bacterium (ex Bugula neritina AB1)]